MRRKDAAHRTAGEPTRARNPLRLRCGLALCGLAWAVSGSAAFAVEGQHRWAIGCAVLAVLIALDLLTVVLRLRRRTRRAPDPER